MWRPRRPRRFATVGLALLFVVLASGCTNGDDETLGSLAGDEEQTAEDDAAETTATVSTTTELATTETSLSAADQEQATGERLMEFHSIHWNLWVDCVEDVAACDPESGLGDSIAAEAELNTINAISQAKESRTNTRECCENSTITVNEDGTETVLVLQPDLLAIG